MRKVGVTEGNPLSGTGRTARLLLTLLCLFSSSWLAAAPLALTPQEQAWIKAHPKIVFGVDEDWQPQFIRNADGSMGGIDGDMVRRLNQILGTNIVIEQGKWNALIERLKRREIDGLSSSAVHEERRSFASFSDPYFTISKMLYVRSDNPLQISRTNDLAGKRIAIQAGNLFDEKLLKSLSGGIVIISKPSLESLVSAVLAGEADGFIGSIASEYRLVKLGITQVVPVLPLEPPIDAVFSIRKDWPELVTILNKGLQQIPETERLQVKQRYLADSRAHGQPRIPLTPAEQAWLAAKHTVRVAVHDYPPYLIREPAPSGIAVDYLEAIARRFNFKLEYVVKDLDAPATLADAAESRQHFDLLPILAQTPERLPRFAWTRPYLEAPWVIYHRDGSPPIIDITDLGGKMLAVARGYSAAERLKADYPGIHLLEVATPADALRAVSTGKADAYVDTLAHANYLIRQQGFTNLRIGAPASFMEQLSGSMAVRKDWPELASLIDKGLAAMTPAEQDAIRNRWVSMAYEPGIPWRIVFFWSALATLAGALILLWNWTLKRQVAARTQALQASVSEIHRLSNYDGLTGLPNRSLFLERLERALAAAHRQPRFGAVILLDIDRFKNINDARSHDFGDRFLVAFGGRIAGLLREEDTLARLAADEFAILLPDLGKHEASAAQRARGFLRKILEDLHTPYCIEADEEIVVTASMGLSLFPAGEPDEDSASDVIRRADTALNRAKAGGGNRFAFFETSMGSQVEDHYRIEHALRHGIPAGQLRLYLQVQVDGAGDAVSAEALVRWQHPERGLLAPGVFIAIAEESDLIVALGIWVMREACRLIAQEEAQGRPLHLSVNISPRHFRQADFVPWLKQVLAETGADPVRLTLEVTEGLVIEDVSDVIAKMTELVALGIHFSIDDFGTGYSSLAYLKRLPIHELKIDKTFVQDAPTDADDAALVETILSIARHMKLKVVAEGVETQVQAEFLNQRATVIHQGYLYGKPEPAEEWIARWHANDAP